MTVHCLYDKLIAIKELTPHPKNRNVHPKDQIERLSKILKYQGWRYPIKVSKLSGCITSGHGRLAAAKVLKMATVPVVFQDYIDEAQEYADLQADNAIASWAELDLSGINLDIGEYGPDFDIDLLGIKGFTVDVAEKDAIEDEVPEQVEAKTKLGDLYRLGDHRLLCGDSTDAAMVSTLVGKERMDMVFTSPPYNGNTTMYDYEIVNGQKKRKDKTLYKDNNSDNKTTEEYLSFLHSVLQECISITDGYVFWNINYNAKSRFEFIESIYPFKEKLQETIVWKKNALPTANGFTRNFEFIFMFKTSDKLKHLNKEYDVVHNFWEISNNNSQQKDHKACFPVALPEKAITISDKTSRVFDPFGGSGSTLIACEKTKRKCFMMELDPHYCDVIVARWEKYSGGKAELTNGPTTS